MASGIADLNSRAKINFSMLFLSISCTSGRRNPGHDARPVSFLFALFPFSNLDSVVEGGKVGGKAEGQDEEVSNWSRW